MGQECLEKAGGRGPSLGRRRVTLGMHKKRWLHTVEALYPVINHCGTAGAWTGRRSPEFE